ncbi:MAG: hypothetical protein V1716_01695 [Candidatus Uhrbacteria bacterium]
MPGERRGEDFSGSGPAEEVPVLVVQPTETFSRKALLPSESEEKEPSTSESEEVEEVRRTGEKAEELATVLSEFEFTEDFPQMVTAYFARYPNVLRGGSGVVDEGQVVFFSVNELLKREMARVKFCSEAAKKQKARNQLVANLSEIEKEFFQLLDLLPVRFNQQFSLLGQVEDLSVQMTRSFLNSKGRLKSIEDSSEVLGRVVARLNSLLFLYSQNQKALEKI